MVAVKLLFDSSNSIEMNIKNLPDSLAGIMEIKEIIKFIDKTKKRISELKTGNDRNNEIHKSKILSKKNIEFTFDNKKLKNCNVFIVTVPTPISAKNLPDLRLLKEACKLVGKFL